VGHEGLPCPRLERGQDGYKKMVNGNNTKKWSEYTTWSECHRVSVLYLKQKRSKKEDLV
jgi:hypothetical protein